MKKFVVALLCASVCLAADMPCRAVFTDQTGVIKELVKDIQNERHLVQIAAGQIANRSVVNALLDAKKRGVVVEVIVDDVKSRPATCLIDLFRNNVPVYVYKPKQYFLKVPHLLHKFCVLSNKVWMGNFALHGKYRHTARESAVIISQASVVEDFMREFELLKLKMCKRAIL